MTLDVRSLSYFNLIERWIFSFFLMQLNANSEAIICLSNYLRLFSIKTMTMPLHELHEPLRQITFGEMLFHNTIYPDYQGVLYISEVCIKISFTDVSQTNIGWIAVKWKVYEVLILNKSAKHIDIPTSSKWQMILTRWLDYDWWVATMLLSCQQLKLPYSTFGCSKLSSLVSLRYGRKKKKKIIIRISVYGHEQNAELEESKHARSNVCRHCVYIHI